MSVPTMSTEHLCRHCQQKPGCYSRGLCANCYNDPSLRVNYPLIENACLRRGEDKPAEIEAAREAIDRMLFAEAFKEQRECAERKAGEARIPFGPYRRRMIKDVDQDYLRWLLPFTTGPFEIDLRLFLRIEIEEMRDHDDD